MNNIVKAMGFHHIALKCRDFNKSMRFYAALGCMIKASWGGSENPVAMVDVGDGGCIELFGGGVDEKTETPALAGEWFHLALSSDDPDTAFAAAIAAGATEKSAPYDAVIPSDPPMPVRVAFVYGPDGEVIEFFHLRNEK